MKVLVATKNKAKLLGVEKAINKYFNDITIQGIDVSSDVSEQPINEEIYKGAINRVENLIKYCSKNNISSDYFIGIESGITNLLGSWVNITIVYIKDKDGIQSIGYSSAYPIPDKYIDDIKEKSLGIFMEKLFKENSSSKGGVNLLTHGEITRIDLTKEATIMALTTFINGSVWREN
ncbi:MAG: DUF84 family protein [Bacilli bacterium]|nr:DUF84 family protein [Bacilli bacterium]